MFKDSITLFDNDSDVQEISSDCSDRLGSDVVVLDDDSNSSSTHQKTADRVSPSSHGSKMLIYPSDGRDLPGGGGQSFSTVATVEGATSIVTNTNITSLPLGAPAADSRLSIPSLPQEGQSREMVRTTQSQNYQFGLYIGTVLDSLDPSHAASVRLSIDTLIFEAQANFNL